MSIDAMIEEQKGKVNVIDREIGELQLKLDALQADKAKEQGVIKGLVMARDSLIGPKQNAKNDARRMRLGSKKRAVYSLVLNGYETIGSVTKALAHTDIDGRYIRDVIRKAIVLNDISGEIDDRFILSADGKELLSRAPIPKDWHQYEFTATKSPRTDSHAPIFPRRAPKVVLPTAGFSLAGGFEREDGG